MRIDIDLSTSDVVDKAYRPTLADVHTLLRGEIVGEEKTTMAIFCAWVLGEKPIFVAGPRASGKTHTTEKIRELIGNTDDEEPGMCIALEAGSEKNAWYQMEEINKARYLLIREYNKLPKEVKELLKDFGEEKPARYDVTVLNQV